LFKSIDGFAETTNMVKQLSINEALGLSHVDFFIKRTLKEGVINVKLCNRPTMLKG
jgi:hypothetical protein